MTYEYPGDGALDYLPCRYGQSKLLFRGPRRQLDGQYFAVLGGTETYGKFVEIPYPSLLEGTLGIPVVNFGYLNAGADVFLNDPSIIRSCNGARATVIQLTGAHNLSNRFYAVHPRRNDRFLRASTLMKTVFREVDFTEFHFTRHMLSALKERAPEKFAILVEELRSAWVARMRSLLQRIEGETVLLWISDGHAALPDRDALGPEPLLVDEEMVDEIRPYASRLVKVAPSRDARDAGTQGMHFAPLDALAATRLPGPRVHQEVADALAPFLKSLV
ncbi:DUF6473 family protein [Ostreiculturibacter nitratireducens]|uniref:DUF6473 family protein n=1 Tax=Ostreiculturibacter nitratireducens TaxID=3075226 RepID=UPI0031B6155F